MKIFKNSNYFLIKKIIKIKKNIFLKNIKIIFEKNFYKNKKKNKIIIILNAMTGSHHFNGIFKKNLKNIGWWNKIINSEIFKLNFNLICFNNILSNFGSTNIWSINPLNNKYYKNYFPKINIKNLIIIQKYILFKLKIKNIYIILGGSFGALQSLIWSLIYPEKVFLTICIAGVNKMNLKNILKNKINKLISNYLENYLKKKYYNYNIKCIKNLKLLRIIGNLSYLSFNDIKKKKEFFLYKKNYKIFKIKQKISNYFYFKSNKFYKIFNIESYIFIMKLINKFNILNFKNSNIKNKNYLFIYFKNDERFNFKDSKLLINFFIKKNYINYKKINLKSGHDSFLVKNDFYINLLNLYFNKYISGW